MRLDLKPVTELSDGERGALKALTAAVYPPDVLGTLPGRSLQLSVLVSEATREHRGRTNFFSVEMHST
jgi:hypothetical protein